ncbi:unnamed protein product [Sphenostylis stenocarpa]|uniref:Uncharacterized protein n=1 Tax=Sphenostylis stenocarpa TaxID=92480 RepID=A0AA86VPN3_9FABA|nr:unnamed protein product [Sphenostylis stenocarpa]
MLYPATTAAAGNINIGMDKWMEDMSSNTFEDRIISILGWEEMEGKTVDEVVDIESASSASFNDDSDDEESLVPEIDDGVHLEEPLTEEEIQDLISELLEVESKEQVPQQHACAKQGLSVMHNSAATVFHCAL